MAALGLIRSASPRPTDLSTRGAGPTTGVGPALDGGPIGPGDLPHAGLVPERTAAMRTAIEEVVVAPAVPGDAPPGAFGPTPSRCAALDDLLPRDLSPVTYRPGSSICRVTSGVLDDPYLGRSLRYADGGSERVAVDHLVPTAYAWQHGAADWTATKRRAFALDPQNRLIADARQVRAKAGRGPAEWLPPNVALRCAYAARFAAVATEYGLTIDPADEEVARRQCREA